MSHLDLLRRAIHRGDALHEENTRAIYSFIQEKVIPAEGIESLPPLPVLTYAINSVLQPPIFWDGMPELLHILAQVEKLRKMIISQAEAALMWDTFVLTQPEHAGEDSIPLTKHEREVIMGLLTEKAKAKLRITYRVLIVELCRIHIYRTRGLPDQSYRIPSMWNDYFPSMDDIPSKKAELLYHADLSSEEEKDLLMTRDAVADFLKEVAEWEERRMLHWKSINPNIDTAGDGEFLSYERDYLDRFKPSVEQDQLLAVLQRYLRKVQVMLDSIAGLFPEEDTHTTNGTATVSVQTLRHGLNSYRLRRSVSGKFLFTDLI